MRFARRGCCFFLCLLLLGSAQQAQAAWYYRVIARDDSLEAQAEKNRVRDAALRTCPRQEEQLIAALPEIKKAAESIAPCRVEVRNWQPANQAPASPTLYITIGEGQGHNCWGILYADSLQMAKAEDMPEEPERVEFVWPIWQWILHLFGL